MNEIKVSQRAREAAAERFEDAFGPTELTREMRLGLHDYDPTIQAFARFEQAVRADERERAAKAAAGADGGAEGYCGPHWRRHQRPGDDAADGRVQELNKISGAQP